MPHRFTAEPDDDDAVNIGVQSKSRQNPLRHFGIGRYVRTADVDDDVDASLHLLRHDAAGFRRTGTRRQNKHVITDADLAVRAFVA